MIEIDKVYNMDCIDLMKEMLRGGVLADMLLTDIPYNIVNVRSNGRERHSGPIIRQIQKGNADVLKFDLHQYLELTDKVVKGNFIIFCATEQISEIRNFYDCLGYTTRLIIWQKSNPSPLKGQFAYLSGIECAIYARKPKATFNAFCKNTVFKHNAGERDIHPTQKPLSLWYELLRDLTNEGDLVLDTCMGSFTTAIACKKMGRHYIGAELDKDFYESGSKRLFDEENQVSLFDLM